MTAIFFAACTETKAPETPVEETVWAVVDSAAEVVDSAAAVVDSAAEAVVEDYPGEVKDVLLNVLGVTYDEYFQPQIAYKIINEGDKKVTNVFISFVFHLENCDIFDTSSFKYIEENVPISLDSNSSIELTCSPSISSNYHFYQCQLKKVRYSDGSVSFY